MRASLHRAAAAETPLPRGDSDSVSRDKAPLTEQDEAAVTGGATKQTLENNNDSAILNWDENSLDSKLHMNANDSIYTLEFPFDEVEEDISEGVSGKSVAECKASLHERLIAQLAGRNCVVRYHGARTSQHLGCSVYTYTVLNTHHLAAYFHAMVLPNQLGHKSLV